MPHDLLTFFVLVCTCCNVVVVNGEQQFVETPTPYQEVSSGKDVLLPCKVKDKRGMCFWQQDGNPRVPTVNKYEWLNNHSNDCSLLIKEASLEYDDGQWVCQVSGSDYRNKDALTSLPSRLLVIAQPEEPILKYEGEKPLDHVLSLNDEEEIMISCTSNYGNPPAFIKWYVGDEEREPLIEQRNISESSKPKTWEAYSLLKLRGRRENHRMPIRCVALHPSSSSKSIAETFLNIRYLPEVRIESSLHPLTATPVESESLVSLKCLADANPPANITWFKDSVSMNSLPEAMTSLYDRIQINGSTQISELRFKPVKRQDTATYSCKAVNVIGESTETARYRLDVQYTPKMKKIEGNSTNDLLKEQVILGSTKDLFECPEFDANPPAQYRWVHPRRKSTALAMANGQYMGNSRRLRLERITWSDQGEYRCLAFNTINGVTKETYNEHSYMLHVIGPPEIQANPSSDHTSNHESIGWVGERVHKLKSQLCSEPPPKLVTWEWGSNQIRAGENIHPKYEALQLEPIIENGLTTNCFWAKLEIKDLQKEDARMYTLSVMSEKGEDSIRIKLIVRDSTETHVIGAAVALGLLLVLTLIFVGVWSLIRLRRRRYRQDLDEEGGIAADALYANGASMDRQKSMNLATHVKTIVKKPNLDSNQSAHDYTHTVKQTCTISPEALKVRRAPMVLQSPTIV